MTFRLPLTLTCVAIEPAPPTGGPMVLDCTVHDAAGEEVRARGHMRININAQTSYEGVSDVLQSYANTTAKDLLAQGKAERVEASEEDRMHQIETVIDVPFIGVAK